MSALPIASEHDEQRAVIEWWALVHHSYGLPEFALFAIPNGAYKRKGAAGRFRAEGLRAGVSDLMLAAPRGIYHGAFVEMKRCGPHRITEEQRAFTEYVASAGYKACIAQGWDEARAFLQSYLGDTVAARLIARGPSSLAPRWLETL